MSDKEQKLKEMENECYLIDKGVRSCAMTVIESADALQFDLLFDLEELVSEHKLHFYIFKDKCYGVDVYKFWIYKFHHQRVLIEYVSSLTECPTYLSEWITGKLLGYSDESIESYLNQMLISDTKFDF